MTSVYRIYSNKVEIKKEWPPNLASKPSTFHSGRYDESSSSRKSSGTIIELQEMHHGHQINRNLTSPLIEQPEEEMKISRMTNRSGTDFVRDMQRQVSLPIIILGIVTVALLVILLSILTGPSNQMVGYRVSDYYISPEGNMYSVALKPINSLIKVPLHGISKTLTLLPNLNMSIQCYGLNHLRVSIRDMDSKRWEIPEEYPYSYATGSEVCDYRDLDVIFDIHQKPFSFKIIRKSTNEPLLNTENFPLVFSKYYMELTTKMPSYDFYGFGERSDKLQMTKGSYTIFPKDQFAAIENGQPGNNLYGQQPVYLMREASGNYHIVLLRNSNAMEIQISDDQTLKYQVVGGVFDFQIFLGSKDPEPVVQAYHKYIGKWTMPPFWSMGFHQSKWGYNNVSALTDVMQKYQDYQIPLDVIWSDIDYMVNYLPFTVDPVNFPAEDLKASIAKFGKKWVPIVDPGIGTSAMAENFAYKRGKQMDIFLKNKSGKYHEGWVWANRSVFPDFFHPQTEEYWLEMLHELDNKVPFDGIWLDMNEIANFCNGTCNRTTKAAPLYDTIPFLPGNISLEHKTTDLEAVHYGNIKEFDAHSLFNLLQQKTTYRYLKTKTPLPFILTRANVFGSGQFSSHWFGDPSSEWIELRNSIAGTLRYNLFGMPHNGADICGYTGTPTPELCTRWTQLGVFYAFARNHHEKKTSNQEPFVFEERYRVPMTEAIRFRYSILKHFYTLFVSKGGLGTLIKPLFFEFPDDQKLLRLQNINGVRYVEEQFMLGKSMMVAPVLYPAMDVVDVYFPENACWYNLMTYELVNSFGGDRIRSIFAPMSTMIPVFIRGGWVIMMQDSSTVMSTKDLNNVFSMVIALPETGPFNIQDSSTVTYTHTAKGEILDIVDYEEVTVYTQCILEEEDCVLKIRVEFSWDVLNKKFKVVVQTNRRKIPGIVQQGTSGNVTTNEIKILGDMMKILNTSGGPGTVSVVNSRNLSETITVSQAQIINDALIIRVNSSDGGGILLSDGSKYIIEN